MDFLATRPDGRFSIAGVDTVSIALHPAARSEVCRAFCTSELMADLCHDLVGPDARLYWDQSVYKRPHGAEPVLWHQDNGYTYIEPQAYLTVWVALTDATPENGCVQVLPGVHRSGTVAHRNTPIGFECCRDPDGAVERSRARRLGRRVLLAHAPRHRAQHDRRHPARRTSCSSRPRAPSASAATRTPAPRSGAIARTRPSVSSPCSSAATRPSA